MHCYVSLPNFEPKTRTSRLLSRAKSTHDKHESESKAKLASFEAQTAVEVAGPGVQSAAREVTRRQGAWGVVG